MEGLSRYIAPFGSSWLYTCSSSEPLLECLSHQTPSLAFLWVVVAKAAVFRGLLHINAARKVVVMHLMWWQQLSHRYSWISFFLVCLWSTSPPLELLGGSFWLLEYILGLYTSHPRRNSSSDHLPLVPYSWDIKLELLTIVCPSSDHLASSDKAQGPIYYSRPLSLQ